MFTIIIVSIRLMGKRQLGELEINELVVTVMISEMATIPIVDESMGLMHGIVPVLTLLLFELAISFFSMKSVKLRKLVSGTPSILVQNGKIVQSAMRKNRFTIDELTEELRIKGTMDISTVKYAILETDGTLSVLLYGAHKPVTHQAMGFQPEDTGLPVLVINDGRVIRQNLKLLGLNEGWLAGELGRRNVKSPSDVFILAVDEKHNVYFTGKE